MKRINAFHIVNTFTIIPNITYLSIIHRLIPFLHHNMDEIIEKVADLVSTLVIAVKDSEEKNTRFGDMVPAADMIRKSADGIFVIYIIVHLKPHVLLSLLFLPFPPPYTICLIHTGMVEAAGLAIDDIHEEFKMQLSNTADDLRV